MLDAKLRRRLARVRIPALVVWGESDRVVDLDYGRAYAHALPNARFELLPEAGHLPWIEQPERFLKAVSEFADSITPSPVAGSSEQRSVTFLLRRMYCEHYDRRACRSTLTSSPIGSAETWHC